MSCSSKDWYSKILKKNNIHDEISSLETAILDLSGDNFGSTCETLTIKFEDKTRDPLELFVKRALTSGEYAKKQRKMMIFEKEAQFFNCIVPDLKQFCKETQGSDEFLDSLFADCLYADENVVVMKNLVKSGSKMLDKKEGHTILQAQIVLDNLAKMHGLTYAYIQTIGLENFENKYPLAIESNFWSSQGFITIGVWCNAVLNAAKTILQNNPVPNSEKTLEFLQTLSWKRLCSPFDLKNKHCGLLLNHGDVWNSNLLFKENPETKTLETCTFIDFQAVHIGSPALDLQKYILISVKSEIRLQSWKQFLKFYYENFEKYVQGFGCKVNFSFEELVKDFKEKSEGGFLVGLFLIFGWESFEFGALEDADGDVMDRITSCIASVGSKFHGEKGRRYATQITKEFEEYEKLRQNID